MLLDADKSKKTVSLDPNQTIWRYMPFTQYVELLRTKSLWCARADCFEDPTEGEWSSEFKYEILKQIEKQDLDTLKCLLYLKGLLSKPNVIDQNDIHRCFQRAINSPHGATLWQQYEERDTKFFIDDPEELLEILDYEIDDCTKNCYESEVTEAKLEEFKHQIERVKKCSFLNCWHLSDDQNMAMWGLYGKSFESIAIKSRVFRLNDLLKANKSFLNKNGITGFVKKVRYVGEDYISEYKHEVEVEENENDVTYALSLKHKIYKYENEVRLILTPLNMEKARPMPEKIKGIKLKISSSRFENNELIEELHVNPLLPPKSWFVDLITHTNKIYGHENIPVINKTLRTIFTR